MDKTFDEMNKKEKESCIQAISAVTGEDKKVIVQNLEKTGRISKSIKTFQKDLDKQFEGMSEKEKFVHLSVIINILTNHLPYNLRYNLFITILSNHGKIEKMNSIIDDFYKDIMAKK